MPKGLIDTHCHLQSARFKADLEDLVAEARERGVLDMIVCAGHRSDWDDCREIAHRYNLAYTLGIHPMAVEASDESDVLLLDSAIQTHLSDPHFVGLGEMGLDGMIEGDMVRQEWFFVEQLKLAKRYDLPCSLHARQCEDRLIKYLNRYPIKGVVHAFNGSEVFRARMLALGLKMGFGGALTYEGSKRIRRHVCDLPAESWVLETDAPDMPKASRRRVGDLRTEPSDLVDTAQLVAELRDESLLRVIEQAFDNAISAFPRLALRHVSLCQ